MAGSRLWHVDDPRQNHRRDVWDGRRLATSRLARARDCWIIWPDAAGKGYALEATHAARNYLYEVQGWDGAVSYIDPKNLDSIRLAERLGAKKDHDAPTIDGSDAVYRHPSPAALRDSQLSHGIEMEISHYADPLFKPKGWALD